MNAAIKALHLRKAYQQNRVIEDLSLEVAEGERRAIACSFRLWENHTAPSACRLGEAGFRGDFYKVAGSLCFSGAAAFAGVHGFGECIGGADRKRKKKMAAEWLLKVGLQKEDFDKLPSEISGGMAKESPLPELLL